MSNRSNHPSGSGASRSLRDPADDGFPGFEEDPLVELARIVSEGNARYRQPLASGAAAGPDGRRPAGDPYPDDPIATEGAADAAAGYVDATRADEWSDTWQEHDPVGGVDRGEAAVDAAYDADAPHDPYVEAREPYADDPYRQPDVPFEDEERWLEETEADTGEPASAGLDRPVAPTAAEALIDHEAWARELEDGLARDLGLSLGRHEDERAFAPAVRPAEEPDAYSDEIHMAGAYEQALRDAVARGGAEPARAAAQYDAGVDADPAAYRQPDYGPDDVDDLEAGPARSDRSLSADLAASLETELLAAADPRASAAWPQGAAWEEPETWPRDGRRDMREKEDGGDDDFLLEATQPAASARLSAAGHQWAAAPIGGAERYDDAAEFEAPPPPGGYDLDAVARAMRESHPHLGGHGVLPPHPEAELQAAPAPARSRRGLYAAAAVMSLVVIGGSAFALLDLGGDAPDGPPAIITASDDPMKIYPDSGDPSPGGASKLIYDRVGGGTSAGEERLVLQDENPPATLPPAPAVEPGGESGSVVPAAPRRVRTVVVRPDGTIISAGEEAETAPERPSTAAPAIAQTPEPASGPASDPVSGPVSGQLEAPRTVTTATVPAPSAPVAPDAPAGAASTTAATADAGPATDAGAAAPANVPRIKPEDIDTLARAATPPPAASAPQPVRTAAATPLDLTQQQSAPAQPAAAVATAPPAAPASAPAAASASTSGSIPAGAFIVQVSSQRTQEQAQAAFNDLQRRYGSVLGGVAPVIERADLGDRGTFYRVRIPAGSRDEAVALCDRLKAAGGDCFVRRN